VAQYLQRCAQDPVGRIVFRELVEFAGGPVRPGKVSLQVPAEEQAALEG